MDDGRRVPAARLPAPARAHGPLGLCYSCCAARKADPEALLAEAVTLVPAQVPVLGPGGQVTGAGVVALPQCWEHIPGPGPDRGTGPVIADGEVPRT